MITASNFKATCDICMEVGLRIFNTEKELRDYFSSERPSCTVLGDLVFCNSCTEKHSRVIINLQFLFRLLELRDHKEEENQRTLWRAAQDMRATKHERDVVIDFFADPLRVWHSADVGGFTLEERRITRELFCQAYPQHKQHKLIMKNDPDDFGNPEEASR